MNSYLKVLFLQYIKSPFAYISFLLPILLLIGFGQMIPPTVVFPLMISTGYIVISLFLFGGTLLEIRKTSFIKSISLTKINKSTMLFINILLASILMILMTFFCLILIYFFDLFNLLVDDWSNWDQENQILKLIKGSIIWGNINWILIFYSIFISAFASLSMAFLIISFSKTQQFLYLISFSYILMFWFLSWLVVPSFFAYGKIEESGSFNFLIKFRYFIPHYWSSILVSNSISANLDFFANLPNFSTFDEFIEYMRDFLVNQGFGQIQIGIIISFLNSFSEEIIGFFNFTQKYYDNSFVDTFFQYSGTIIFGTIFLLISTKYFSWSIR